VPISLLVCCDRIVLSAKGSFSRLIRRKDGKTLHDVCVLSGCVDACRRSQMLRVRRYWDNRLFQTRRLNAAFKGLLACVGVSAVWCDAACSIVAGLTRALCDVQEMCKVAQDVDRSLRLPYVIHEDRVANFRVTLGEDVEWTAAMKAMLTLLKWLLAWVVRNPSRSEGVPFGTMGSERG